MYKIGIFGQPITTTIITEFPPEFGNPFIKSIEISVQTLVGIGNG